MTLFVGVPITLIILGIAIWALLSSMPFSRDKKLSRTEQPAPAVINEQPGSTATTSEIPNPGVSDAIATTTTAMPAGMPAPPPPPQQVAPQTQPLENPAPSAGEVSESQAEDIVRDYVASRDYYGVGADCIGAASQGYKNGGYTIHVVDRCGDRGRLGRWRVDSGTREVFVQKADGRYLPP